MGIAAPLIVGSGALLGGALGGLLGRPKQYGFSRGDIEYYAASRWGEISQFEKSLASARSNYQTQLMNLQNLAFNRFVPQAEAQFAGRGFSPIGGAYQSALARQSADLQAQGLLGLAEKERQDLSEVNQARGQVTASLLGQQPSAPSPSPWGGVASGLGNLGTQLLLGYYLNQPGGGGSRQSTYGGPTGAYGSPTGIEGPAYRKSYPSFGGF